MRTTLISRAVHLAVAIAAATLVTQPVAHGHESDRKPESALKPRQLGSLALGGAEIAAWDPGSSRLYVTNAGTNTVAIVNASNPGRLVKTGIIDVSSLGSPNSVAVRDGIVAVAIENADKTLPGKIGFYRSNGGFITSVVVGALPDMLTFTPDGRHLLVANEGEPSGYGPGFTDPEGSVSIIRLPKQLRDLRAE